MTSGRTYDDARRRTRWSFGVVARLVRSVVSRATLAVLALSLLTFVQWGGSHRAPSDDARPLSTGDCVIPGKHGRLVCRAEYSTWPGASRLRIVPDASADPPAPEAMLHVLGLHKTVLERQVWQPDGTLNRYVHGVWSCGWPLRFLYYSWEEQPLDPSSESVTAQARSYGAPRRMVVHNGVLRHSGTSANASTLEAVPYGVVWRAFAGNIGLITLLIIVTEACGGGLMMKWRRLVAREYGGAREARTDGTA